MQETFDKKFGLNASLAQQSLDQLTQTFTQSKSWSNKSSVPIINSYEIRLKPRMTFKNYIIGEHNLTAYQACQHILDQTTPLFNPLFIHGPSGVGKTHLLQAMAHHLNAKQATLKMSYITAEAFSYHFISAIQNNSLARFRQHYRNIDLLMIEDIHILAKKKSTIKEFYHTFNELQSEGKQIIITSDCPIHEIKDIQEGLVSRFHAGLSLTIDKPSLETRLEIVQHKLKIKKLYVPLVLQQKIAQTIDGNIRTVEGVIQKLHTYCKTSMQPVTSPLLDHIMEPFSKTTCPNELMTNIVKIVSKHFHIKTQDILSTQKTRSYTRPRYLAITLARELTTDTSLDNIGEFFGKRTRASIIKALKASEKLRATCSLFEQDLQAIKNKASVL